MENNNRIVVLLPVYNDWDSLCKLLSKFVSDLPADQATKFSFVVVNDDSSNEMPALPLAPVNLEILHLRRNMGHQRAIAIGLSWIAAERPDYESVIVMDADGEDEPGGVIKLLEAHQNNPGKIIFADRKKRHDSILFQVNYFFYKKLFSVMTGNHISFGNFSLIPMKSLKKLVFITEIWNHYSGGVIRAKLPYTTVPLDKGNRLSGKSKMNFISLVLHGLSSISVHLDTMAVRLLVFFLTLSMIAGVGILVVLYYKFLTNFAIPGWATSAISGLTLMFLQALLTSFFLAFIVLVYKMQRMVIPALDYKDYIENIEISA